MAGAGVLGPGQRWSASRKRDVVLRLLRGESLDAVSREVGVEIYRLEEWKERALAGLELGLKDPAGEPAGAALDAAKRHIGELSMENGSARGCGATAGGRAERRQALCRCTRVALDQSAWTNRCSSAVATRELSPVWPESRTAG